jgi:hypothetical protein
MTAGDGETNPVFFLYADFRVNFYAFKRASHIAFVCSGESAIIFAQVAAQTPFFVYIYSFHDFTSTKKALQTKSAGINPRNKSTAPLLFRFAQESVKIRHPNKSTYKKLLIY